MLLCIDQESLPEKSKQDRHMHEVYRYTQTTLIWLVPGSEELYLAMDSLLGPQLIEAMGPPPWPYDREGRLAISVMTSPKRRSRMAGRLQLVL